ncbi:MAG: HD domain-containing protein [Candidatus Aenigmatarchaeota archaeon]
MNDYIIKTSLREVDCTSYKPIVKHPCFQRLKRIKQLSFVNTEYVGAEHTRYDHSCVVKHFTDEITSHLLRKGCIDRGDRENLRIASLLHDIGHPPNAHATEFVLEAIKKKEGKEFDHKQRAVEIIERDKDLRNAIENCGGDVETVEQIILKKNHLSPIISHNTLGADKTGYTLLDSNRTNYSWPEMPFFLDTFRKYFFDGKVLGIEDKEKENQIKALQSFYQAMYTDVYFHPKVRFFERQFERAVQTAVEDNVITTEKLCDIEEFELNYLLNNNKKTKTFLERILKEEMGEYVTSVTYDPTNEVKSKSIFNFYSNPLNLTKAELAIANEFVCKPEEVSCILRAIPNRIIPEDVFIFSERKSIFEIDLPHQQSLINSANQSTFISIYKDPRIKIDDKICKEIITEQVFGQS